MIGGGSCQVASGSFGACTDNNPSGHVRYSAENGTNSAYRRPVMGHCGLVALPATHRRVAIRYGKLAANGPAFVKLASIRI